MATIHRIDAHHDKRTPTRSAGATGAATADIILFPGVRYERWSEAQALTRSSGSGRKQRDRLEIAD
jgi:hypothetical protein